MTTFSSVLPHWNKTTDPWSFGMLMGREPQPFNFKLQERDLEIMQALLEQRFLTTQQLASLYFSEGDGGLRYTQIRMKLLFEVGLIMKIRPRTGEPGSKPNIFALTQLGFDLLIQSGQVDRQEASAIFHTEEENQVSFDYMIHDLLLNEICLEIFKEADRRRLSFEWLPTKMCRQSVKMPDGKYRIVEPDAIFLFYSKHKQIVLHIEYERSADPRRFRQKLTKWKLYRGQQTWKERYETEPWICVIGDREGWATGGRKRRIVKSIIPLMKQAYNEAFRKICFLPTDEIEDKTWNCLPYPENTYTLWEHLKLD